MDRIIDKYLLEWKEDPSRKVMLLRGARQVGKTYSIRKLGESFQHFLEINFEEERDLKSIFHGSLSPGDLCEKLSAFFSVPIIPGETLLFFDEIQACPEALSSLRFFHEKMPELHVIAAGSLLEFALSEIPSQGVGRISPLFMYPMSFVEFLTANGAKPMVDLVSKSRGQNPLEDVFHKKLIDYLKTYLLIGGMPEVVEAYVKQRDLILCQKKLDDLLITLRDDFTKYKKRAPVVRLREVFDSIVFQAGTKFKYSNIESPSSSHSLKDALDLLVQAGLAYKVYHTAARGLPLGAQIDTKKFKVILFDVGIHQRLLGLDLQSYLLAEGFQGINKGNMAEVFAGLELLHNRPLNLKHQLFYWHKEARGSNAEIDYLIQQGEKIVPVEVKAGTKGQMQSMHIFLESRGISRGIRTSLENFCEYEKTKVIPLYAIHILGSISSLG